MKKRRRAYNIDRCLEYWLWYPTPEGIWKILVDVGHERHLQLWMKVGANKMLRAWGLDPMKIPEIEMKATWFSGAIPNGTIDTREISGRDIMSIYIGKEMPPGWTVADIRPHLMCGKNIQGVEHVGGKRDLNYMAYDKLVQKLHQWKSEGKVPT